MKPSAEPAEERGGDKALELAALAAEQRFAHVRK
jgi:hypothetical protein